MVYHADSWSPVIARCVQGKLLMHYTCWFFSFFAICSHLKLKECKILQLELENVSIQLRANLRRTSPCQFDIYTTMYWFILQTKHHCTCLLFSTWEVRQGHFRFKTSLDFLLQQRKLKGSLCCTVCPNLKNKNKNFHSNRQVIIVLPLLSFKFTRMNILSCHQFLH